MQKINEDKDICTISESKCGYLINGYCTHLDRCAYRLSEKRFKPWNKNEKSTIETVLECEKKHGKALKPSEILAITPKEEILTESYRNEEGELKIATFVVDSKGNILNIQNRRIIRRKY